VSAEKHGAAFGIGLVLIALTLAIALFAIVRWQATLAYFGSFLVYSEAPQPADLILVLAGDFYGPRVTKAAELAKQGYAPKVLISGTPYQGRPEGELAIAFLSKQGYRSDWFESFGHHARSTIEEALVLRPELKRRGVKRVILVTSGFHSRRAALVLWLICSGIHFISVPATDSFYQADQWWKNRGSRKLFFSEWSKIVGSLVTAYPEYWLSGAGVLTSKYQ
jgi:uncharacterized SAM-binding protein YcdF (DUF218 family)